METDLVAVTLDWIQEKRRSNSAEAHRLQRNLPYPAPEENVKHLRAAVCIQLGLTMSEFLDPQGDELAILGRRIAVFLLRTDLYRKEPQVCQDLNCDLVEVKDHWRWVFAHLLNDFELQWDIETVRLIYDERVGGGDGRT